MSGIQEEILPFMKIADELDPFAAAILDKKMCSELCPCYDKCHN